MSEKDIFERLDAFFNELDQAGSTINEIGKKVQKNAQSISQEINESLKQNGYDTVTEFIHGEMFDKKGQRPYVPSLLKEFDSRYAYIQEALSHITYDLKYRGYYKEGHQDALQQGLTLLEEYRDDLDSLAKHIQEHVNEMKHHRSKNKDAYTNGYIQGCQLIKKTILDSKKKMMKKVLNELHC